MSFSRETFTCCLVCYFYIYITSTKGKVVTLNGWKTAGIYDPLKSGSSKLLKMDAFHDINPLIVENAILVEKNLDNVCQLD